ncbi:hypothetical protein OG203_00650 [Nocardia sp. NBC_01499]|uniref:hypothetical protein n=1 Tax=Nocardia sp. NBC_01499 TaxID=2903597 RepID=UPI00386CB3CA
MAAFAEDSRVHELEIREPEVAWMVTFGVEAPVADFGLNGLFPDWRSGFYDGARVSVPVAVELVRAMLRDNGAWCRLEVEDRFLVHVGYDQYVYLGSVDPCERAQARAVDLGLFVEPIKQSPYAADDADYANTVVADDEFWNRVKAAVPVGGSLMLAEAHVANDWRRHRITSQNLAQVRSELGPRAEVRIWEPSPDDDDIETPWPLLFIGVLPDADGVLRRRRARLLDE